MLWTFRRHVHDVLLKRFDALIILFWILQYIYAVVIQLRYIWCRLLCLRHQHLWAKLRQLCYRWMRSELRELQGFTREVPGHYNHDSSSWRLLCREPEWRFKLLSWLRLLSRGLKLMDFEQQFWQPLLCWWWPERWWWGWIYAKVLLWLYRHNVRLSGLYERWSWSFVVKKNSC